MTERLRLFSHPKYDKHIKVWNQLQDLLDGDREKLVEPKYLYPHRIEMTRLSVLGRNDSREVVDDGGAVLRRIRENNTAYMNFSKILLFLWNSLIFKDEIDYTEVSDGDNPLLSEEEMSNIDGQGTHIDSFIKNLIIAGRLNLGKVAVIANALGNASVESVVDETDHRIVLDLITAISFKDWELESQDPQRLGRFNLLRWEYKIIEPRFSLQTAPVVRQRSREYTRTPEGVFATVYQVVTDKLGKEIRNKKTGDFEWEIIQGPMPISSTQATIEEIPLAIMDSFSWLERVMPESLRFHNLRSTKDNVLLAQGYDKMFIAGVPLDSSYIEHLGEHVVTFLPENASVTNIAPVDTGAHERAIAGAVDFIFKVGLNMFRLLPQDSRAGQAADSMREDKENAVAAVRTLVNELQGFLDDMVRGIAIMKGRPDFDGKIKLNKDITVDDVEQFLVVTAAFKESIVQSEDWHRSTLKKALKKQKLPEEDENRILEEIDTLSFEARPQQGTNRLEQRAQRQSILRNLINGNTSGAADQASDNS